MNISQAAAQVGIPAKTIRYYEDIGLVTAHRAANGYRVYDERNLHMLSFLARARGLGFSIESCRSLLDLYQDPERQSAEVKSVARVHVAEIEAKIQELESMRQTLSHLIQCCQGNDRPDCPILDELAGSPSR